MQSSTPSVVSTLVNLSTAPNPIYTQYQAIDNKNQINAFFGTQAGMSAAFGSSTNTPVDIFTNNNRRMRVDIVGNVCIGNNSPLDKLDILGTTASNPGHVVFGDGGNNLPYMKFYKWTGTGTSYFQTTIGNSLDAAGAISFQTGAGGGVIGSDGQTTRMIITQQGNVGINTTNTQGYTFAVNGTCVATAITVKAYGNWPDYVFKKDYNLPTLTEVKTYIDKNQHLPEMPSAEQLERDGLNLGEMNKLLVKKVEELTLYLIEKDKKEKIQEEKITDQQKQIELINKQLQVLINQKSNKKTAN